MIAIVLSTPVRVIAAMIVTGVLLVGGGWIIQRAVLRIIEAITRRIRTSELGHDLYLTRRLLEARLVKFQIRSDSQRIARELDQELRRRS